jgi:hypothetical protein
MTIFKSMQSFQVDGKVAQLKKKKDIMLNQVQKQASNNQQLDNQPTMETTLSQLQMHLEEDLNSLIPTLVLVNGGKSNSTKNIGLIK